MYVITRSLIDDGLMGPTLGPITTLVLVLVIAFLALQIISPGDADE